LSRVGRLVFELGLKWLLDREGILSTEGGSIIVGNAMDGGEDDVYFIIRGKRA